MKTITAIENVMSMNLALRRGEEVNQYQHARAYAAVMMPRILEWLDAGISRADVITTLAMATGVKRHIASEVICKSLKKTGYIAKPEADDGDDDDAARDQITAKTEVSDAMPVAEKPVSAAPVPSEKPRAAPAPSATPAPVLAEKPKAAPAPVVQPANSAASTKSDKDATAAPVAEGKEDKWAHLRGKRIIVGKGFLGQEHEYMSPEEIQADKDRRARIEEVSIASGKLDWKK